MLAPFWNIHARKFQLQIGVLLEWNQIPVEKAAHHCRFQVSMGLWNLPALHHRQSLFLAHQQTDSPSLPAVGVRTKVGAILQSLKCCQLHKIAHSAEDHQVGWRRHRSQFFLVPNIASSAFGRYYKIERRLRQGLRMPDEPNKTEGDHSLQRLVKDKAQ